MEDGRYGNPADGGAKQERSIRQLSSIKNSLSFRLGNLIVNSTLKPWKLILFPINFLILLWNYGRERIGARNLTEGDLELADGRGNRNCAVLFPTNGVGMGHYARS